ncbi:MAG: AraC family transcriptional regulator [Gammaproteobacteria bacterium]
MTEPSDSSDGGAEPSFQFGGDLATPQRLAYGLVPLIQLLEARGHDVGEVLDATEIPRFALEEPSFRIGVAQEVDFTRRALALLDEPLAALEVGRRFHLSMFGLFGLAAACAPSVREALHIFLSYPALVWGLNEVTFWRQGDEEYVAFRPGAAAAELAGHFIERDMAALLMMLRNVLGEGIRPDALMLTRPPPPQAAAYDAFFGCPVVFAAAADRIRFPAMVWDAVPPQANAMSRRFFENQCRRLSESMAAPFRFTDIVRARLRAATPIPSLAALGSVLYLTTRTLQRRLRAEGTSYSQVLREVRIERAEALLRQPGVRIEAIAWRLGFEGPDAFSRAFRAWQGCAPSVFRSRLQR